MLNETKDFEATYAGIYAGNFTDGPYTTIPLTKYLLADFTTATFPNDTSRIKP